MATQPQSTDDAIRERHGCHCRVNNGGQTASHVEVWEREDQIAIKHNDSFGAVLTPWQARYLASKLYRLSRRIRARVSL